MALDSTQPPI